MGKIKISIIIAVYNAEKYLNDTLESILNQTLKDFEVIAIDDGSKDKSVEILKQYENKFDNFTIIEQENKGSYKTRLVGVDRAVGEYITFVDCDDIIENTFLEDMYTEITRTNSDIAVCGFVRKDFETKHIYSKEMCNHKETLVDIKKNPEYLLQTNPALWNKMFKSEVIKNVKEFENTPKILDDLTYMSLIYLRARNIIYINKVLYNYMVHSNSIISMLTEQDIDSDKKVLVEVKNEYEKAKVDKSMLEILAAIAFIHVVVSFQYRLYLHNKKDYKRIKNITDEYMKENFPEYRKTKYLSLVFCLRNKLINLKSVIMKKIYDFNMFKLFLEVYYFCINKLKIDFKW